MENLPNHEEAELMPEDTPSQSEMPAERESQDVEMEEAPNPTQGSSSSIPTKQELSSASAAPESLFKNEALNRIYNLVKPPGHAASNPKDITEEILIQNEDMFQENGTEEADDEWLSSDEIEESFAVVDINGFVDSNVINERVSDDLCTIRHVETENPVVQIGGQLFAGKYKEAEGSILVIEQNNQIGQRSFSLAGITDIIIDARKTYLYAKGDEESNEPGEIRRPINMKLEQLNNRALPSYFKKKL